MLVRLMRRPADTRPSWGTRPTRVLFLRHDRAGDMILSTGVMRAIASSYPTVTLDVLASPANAAIVEGADYLAEIIVFDKRKLASYLPTARRLRRARYDAVVDCMVTAPSVTTLLLILASGARHRVGIAGRGNDSAFTVTVQSDAPPGTHMVDRLAVLAKAFDVELREVDRRPSLNLTEAERSWADGIWGSEKPRVLVNISAGGSDRIWPDQNYAAVMEHIRERSPAATLKVIASPAEAARGESIAMSGKGAYVTTPTIRHAMALVATADFVFTPDTSIAHAMSAFRRPGVAIYGRGKRAEWALYGTLGRSVEHSGPLPELPVDRAIEAVDDVWSDARL